MAQYSETVCLKTTAVFVFTHVRKDHDNRSKQSLTGRRETRFFRSNMDLKQSWKYKAIVLKNQKIQVKRFHRILNLNLALLVTFEVTPSFKALDDREQQPFSN